MAGETENLGKYAETGGPGRAKGSIGGRKAYIFNLDAFHNREDAKQTWEYNNSFWMAYLRETYEMFSAGKIKHGELVERVRLFRKEYWDPFVAPFMPKDVDVNLGGSAFPTAAEFLAAVQAHQEEAKQKAGNGG